MQAVVSDDKGQLRLTRKPINVWTAAGVISALGLAGMIAVIIQHNAMAWVGVIVFVIPLIFGVIMLATCGRIEMAIFSKESNRYYILKKAVFGYKKITEEGMLNEIVGVEIENRQPDSGNWLFREIIVLEGGRRVALSGYHTKLRKAKHIASSLRSFLAIEDDPNVDPDLLELEFIGE